MKKNKIPKTKPRPRVHHILAYSYMVYLFALGFGIIFSAIMPFKIIDSECLMNFSVIILLISSALILWAQKSSRKLNKENLTKESFMNGPYKFTRNPTNVGLFFATISFGVLINSLFVIFFVLIAFLFSRLIFIKRQEKLLATKYGEPYLAYKRKVKF